MGGDHRAFVYAAGAWETSWELFLGVGLPQGVKLIWCRCFWMFRGRWSCLHPSTCPSISRSPRVNLLTKKMCSHPQKLGLSERHADEEGSSQRGWLCCSSAQRRQLWSRRLLLSSSLELGGLGWDNRPPGEAQVPLGKGEETITRKVLLAAGTKKVIISKAEALRCESRGSQHCQITMGKSRHRWRDRRVSPNPPQSACLREAAFCE